MKKTIKGITYDIYKAEDYHTFTNDDESAEYDLCLFRDGCILVKELHDAPAPAATSTSRPPPRVVLRQLTRQQAMELIVENLIPSLLRVFVGTFAVGMAGMTMPDFLFALKSAKNAAFINRAVPGANIPQAVIDRLAAAADPADEGISIAAEQVARYAAVAQGVHLMAVKAEERIPLILERAGISSRC